MKKEEAFKIGLPKWPQCIISGKSVTKEQALEIIRRTDSFFSGCEGNNHTFNDEARSICKIPNIRDEKYGYNFKAYFKDKDDFNKIWGLVETQYLLNHWISSSYIYGVNGFCHPDGTIEYHHNIGKYPSVRDIYDDLKLLGQAFPFLDMHCTLMNAEECEYGEGLVTLHLKNGRIRFMKPIIKISHEPADEDIMNNLLMRKENSFDLEQLKKWANQIYEG